MRNGPSPFATGPVCRLYSFPDRQGIFLRHDTMQTRRLTRHDALTLADRIREGITLRDIRAVREAEERRGRRPWERRVVAR